MESVLCWTTPNSAEIIPGNFCEFRDIKNCNSALFCLPFMAHRHARPPSPSPPAAMETGFIPGRSVLQRYTLVEQIECLLRGMVVGGRPCALTWLAHGHQNWDKHFSQVKSIDLFAATVSN